MKSAWGRIAAAVAAGLAVWGPAQAQLGAVAGLPPLALPAVPPAPAATPAASQASVSSAGVAPGALATSALSRVAAPAPTARTADQAAAVAAKLPPIGAGGAVATLELSTSLEPRALSVSRDALGVVSLKAAAPISAVAASLATDAESYRAQADALLALHPEAVEPDAAGHPALRGEILGLDVSPAALAQARAAGFAVRAQETVAGLDLATVTLATPRGMAAAEALRRLRALDPAGRYDLDHIYFESGVAAAGRPAVGSANPRPAKGLRIGLVDGAAPAAIPALQHARLVQQAFAPGGLKATAHGAAVASLLVGEGPGFRGAAPGATLYVADVYGTTPAGGSALAVVRALGWLVQARVPVVNVSLVGPPNAVLGAAVAATLARGHLIVAAVGNEGPAAPPLYPAAYPGVVAVTGVDARRRVLPEAGRGAQVAFAAPGADMLASGLDGAMAEVRGTSFAAPLVAGRLAALLPEADPGRARQAVEALARQAVDLGARGPDPVYGRGLVAFELAVRPQTVRYAAGPR
ncbi:MAG: S8 family serine peptidase [Caulobacterales bacterium]|nr:S8 family serine peptidase [Caulobacterales bacterium]